MRELCDNQPAAELARTVVLPFTTPLLAGARARPKAHGGFEVLVPNPAGGRGFYVMEPGALEIFCGLTLHDELLLEEILALDELTPAAVRQAARKVALTGAAGREAAEASARAAERDAAVERLAQLCLLLKTLEAAGVRDIDPAQLDPDRSDVRSYVKSRLRSFAQQLKIPVDELLDMVAEIAVYAAAVGFRTGQFKSRHGQTLERIAALAAGLKRWITVETKEVAATAKRVVEAAVRTREEAQRAIDEAQALLDDIAGLLRRWQTNRTETTAILTRCDWLLDGWPEACTLWEAAARDGRPFQRLTLQQIDRLLSARHDMQEQRFRLNDEAALKRGRYVRLHEDWRQGVAAAQQLARRERLRAGMLA